MTKEELKKEAEEKAAIYFGSLEVDNGNVSDTRFSDYDVFVAYEKGALDFAEPREKRIEELEKENKQLKEKLDAIDKAGEQVRQQINDAFRDKPSYAELEKENIKLQDQLTKAKELIENIIRVTWGEGWNYSLNVKVKAEQFLKE